MLGFQNCLPHSQKHICLDLCILALMFCWGFSVSGYGQVQITEITLTSQIVEPQSESKVFKLKISDIDPLADDAGNVRINCFLIQNLGSATDQDIVGIQIKDETGLIHATPQVPTAPPAADPGDCPTGATAGGNVSFEAFISTFTSGGEFTITDDGEKTFDIEVFAAATNVLGANSQNHTLELRVAILFEESVGSPTTDKTFTDSIVDGTPDRVFNGGINRIEAVDFTLNPLPIGGAKGGIVARFELCDRDGDDVDANDDVLKITTLRLFQGESGSALDSDIADFSVEVVPGSLGSASGTTTPGKAFNRGGSGHDFAVTLEIPDDQCATFQITAITSGGAMRGRTVHLRIMFFAEEGDSTVLAPPVGEIDPSVAPILQIPQSVMIGSGILSIEDVELSFIDAVQTQSVAIKMEGFPANKELGRMDIQTTSIKFNPNILQIQGIIPTSPFVVQNSNLDFANRTGELQFTLTLGGIGPNGEATIALGDLETQTQSVRGISTIAEIIVSKTSVAVPGQSSLLLFEVNRAFDIELNEITSSIILQSGKVTLISPGDIDSDGAPTVRDALKLAKYILSCLGQAIADEDQLTDIQKKIADVAEPRAAPGTVPGCNELTSADVSRIAKLAITFIGFSSSANLNPSTALRPQQSAWWQRLINYFFKTANSVEPATVALTRSEDGSTLTLNADSDRAVAAIQGRIVFDPRHLQVQSVYGINGYELLAYEVDPVGGEVRFVMLARPTGTPTTAVLGMEIQSSDFYIAKPTAQIQYLLDADARDIPFHLVNHQVASAVPLMVEALRVATLESTHWQLQVLGQGIESVRIEGFDLSGRRRFEAESMGASPLQWHMLDHQGRPFANGVYLYVVTVRGLSGEVWRSEVKKLVVLR